MLIDVNSLDTFSGFLVTISDELHSSPVGKNAQINGEKTIIVLAN